MVDETLITKAKALREQIEEKKHERRKSDSASVVQVGRTASKDDRGDATTAGTTVESSGIASGITQRSHPTPDRNRQPVEDILERSRQSSRRPSDNGRSTAKDDSGPGGSRPAIAVEILDEIPVRDFDYSPEEQPIQEKNDDFVKEQVKTGIRGFFSGGRREKKGKHQPLNDKEAVHYAEILPDLLVDLGGYTDKAIAWYSKQDIEVMGDIWGNLSQEEANQITKILIKRGKRNGEAAHFIRNMDELYEYVALGAIFVPRVHKTVEEVRKAPPRRPIRGFKR